MKNDFRKMEDEMDHLATNMAAITDFSASISSTLQDRRQQITKLSGVHLLLKKVGVCSSLFAPKAALHMERKYCFRSVLWLNFVLNPPSGILKFTYYFDNIELTYFFIFFFIGQL